MYVFTTMWVTTKLHFYFQEHLHKHVCIWHVCDIIMILYTAHRYDIVFRNRRHYIISTYALKIVNWKKILCFCFASLYLKSQNVIMDINVQKERKRNVKNLLLWNHFIFQCQEALETFEKIFCEVKFLFYIPVF